MTLLNSIVGMSNVKTIKVKNSPQIVDETAKPPFLSDDLVPNGFLTNKRWKLLKAEND